MINNRGIKFVVEYSCVRGNVLDSAARCLLAKRECSNPQKIESNACLWSVMRYEVESIDASHTLTKTNIKLIDIVESDSRFANRYIVKIVSRIEDRERRYSVETIIFKVTFPSPRPILNAVNNR